MTNEPLTIGALAKRAGVSTSLLRYYEKEGLLQPSGRTPAGYRLYAAESERTLRFIRTAQRYGFSLNDIRTLLGKQSDDCQDVQDLAAQRLLEIERRVTEMLVLRHELALFLDDVAHHIDRTVGDHASKHYRDLLDQAADHEHPNSESSSLQKLLERLECNLATKEWETLVADLRHRHMHIWRDDDGYAAQFFDDDPQLAHSLERLAATEADCQAHISPEIAPAEGGVVFKARGENAFLYAQLFLALEHGAP